MAQPPSFTYIRESDGLNNNTTWASNCLLIDEHSFAWIATMSGLNRYDGYSVRSYNGTGPAPYDLPYNKIVAIAEDPQGKIWLGTQEEGIIIYDPRYETFAHFDGDDRLASISMTQINHLAMHPDGSMIIACAFEGLYKYVIDRDSMVYIPLDVNSDAQRNLNNICVLEDGRIVVLTYKGVYLQNPNGGFNYFPVSSSIFLSYAMQMPDKKVRIFSQQLPDYYVLDPEEATMYLEKNPVPLQNCSCTMDQDGNYWSSQYDGSLVRFDLSEGKWEHYEAFADIDGVRSNICMKDMQPDHRGNVYYMSVATGAGKFNTIPLPFTFVRPKMPGILKTYRNTLYLAYADTLMVLSDSGATMIPLQWKSNASIFDFIVDHQGDIWVSYAEDYPPFVHFDPHGTLIGKTYSGRMFSQMLELQDGTITIGNKKSQSDPDSLPYTFAGSYYETLAGEAWPDFRLKYYTQTRDGDLWMASFASGLVRVESNMKSFKRFPIDAQGNGNLNSNNPYYIYETRDRRVYVSTDKGINIWDPSEDRFSFLNSTEVDLQDIKGMAESADSAVWILTRHDLARYLPRDSSLSLFPLPSEYRVEYQEPKDLYISPHGDLYYQAFSGAVRVELEKLLSQEAPDPVLFTALYVNRKRVHPGDDYGLLDSSIMFQHVLKVPFELRDLGFQFVSPQGSDVGAKYYYRLKGYHDSWDIAPADRTLHFTSLSPGKYNFEVKAKSATGKWTASTASVTFRIAAPWYQQWWAYILYALLASSVAYLFYRYRVNQLIKYQRLRTKISSDLHDDVGSILGSIAMESEMLAYQADPEKAPLLKRLSALSREAMGRMRDTVWAIDSRKDSLDFLTDRIKDYLAETLSRTKFSYTFQDSTQLNNKPLAPDTRQNVYLIFKEAINNILKHSNGDHVEVSLSKDGSRIILTIRDNGTVKEPINTSGLGISNMKLRAEAIVGDVSIGYKDGFEVRLRW